MLNTKVRTDEVEEMDDFSIGDIGLEKVLKKLDIINDVLGGNKITSDGIKKLLINQNKSKAIKIIDIGCGSGDMLRRLANFAKKENWNFELVGVDANQYTINYARQISIEYKNISYACLDIFSPQFAELEYDIALCTLTLHHFKDDQIEFLLTMLYKNAQLGIIINDLQRSKLAYRLFQIYCTIFRLDGMSKADGLVSILRGFKRKDLEQFSKKLNLQNDEIHWKWAFRYQWIIPSL